MDKKIALPFGSGCELTKKGLLTLILDKSDFLEKNEPEYIKLFNMIETDEDCNLCNRILSLYTKHVVNVLTECNFLDLNFK